MASNKSKLPSALHLNDVKELPFIVYPGFDVVFERWLETKFPKARNLSWEYLNIVGEMNSLSGVVDMVLGHIGSTIIPRHCVDFHLKKNKLAEIDGPTSRKADNEIFIVTLRDRVIPRRVSTVMDSFNRMKKAP